jgi:hypothetical protein
LYHLIVIFILLNDIFQRRFTSVCDLEWNAFDLFVINVYDLPRVTECLLNLLKLLS